MLFFLSFVSHQQRPSCTLFVVWPTLRHLSTSCSQPLYRPLCSCPASLSRTRSPSRTPASASYISQSPYLLAGHAHGVQNVSRTEDLAPPACPPSTMCDSSVDRPIRTPRGGERQEITNSISKEICLFPCVFAIYSDYLCLCCLDALRRSDTSLSLRLAPMPRLLLSTNNVPERHLPSSTSTFPIGLFPLFPSPPLKLRTL